MLQQSQLHPLMRISISHPRAKCNRISSLYFAGNITVQEKEKKKRIDAVVSQIALNALANDGIVGSTIHLPLNLTWLDSIPMPVESDGALTLYCM